LNKNIYLLLAVVGMTVPYYFLLQFIGENGFDLARLVHDLFNNEISTFFAVDLVLATVVFWLYVQAETNKLHMKNGWLYILASLVIGLSFALPLFLFFRKRRTDFLREREQRHRARELEPEN
jgi:hypothetical protein